MNLQIYVEKIIICSLSINDKLIFAIKGSIDMMMMLYNLRTIDDIK